MHECESSETQQAWMDTQVKNNYKNQILKIDTVIKIDGYDTMTQYNMLFSNYILTCKMHTLVHSFFCLLKVIGVVVSFFIILLVNILKMLQ